MLDKVKGGLIVSCQALEGEPLYGADMMKRMAYAAVSGGAVAIRANGREDIAAIQSAVDVPVIGIVKRDYPDSEVYITATVREVEELTSIGVDMIALDATKRVRPGGIDLASFMRELRERFPRQRWMADCSTVEECVTAEALGFDCVGTTMHGYTPYTAGRKVYERDFAFLADVIQAVRVPVIAEGNILTPEMAAAALRLGAHAVVVGGAITRPQQITERFVSAINGI